MLKDANPKMRNAILNNCDSTSIKSICEIALNVLNGNYPLTPSQIQRLRGYKNKMRSLACSKTTLCSKKKILKQKGGFLPTLLSTVLSGLLGKILST